MPYGLELAFAQVGDHSSWSGGYLHLSGYSTFDTPGQVLDHIEEWAELGHGGQVPWENPGPVDVVGIIFDQSHHGQPLVTYTPQFLPGGYFDGYFGPATPPTRQEVEEFLHRHVEQPELTAPDPLWIKVDGLLNKVHDYTGHALANLRARQ